MAEVSAALVSARIVAISEKADGWELLVFPDSSQWNVEWTYTREEMTAFLSYINRAAGQCQGELIEPAPCLVRTLAEVSAENASSQFGNRPAPAVPKIVTSSQPAHLATHLNKLEVKVSNPSKAYSFETLNFKGALLAIEGMDEIQAMEGCRQILKDKIMDNDGGKWRNRWRMNRSKVHRVFAAAVEDMNARKVRNPGAHTEFLWKQFA